MFYTRDTLRNCPNCGASKARYVEIPEHRRTWVQDGVEHVEHWGPVRDYKCDDCDSEWVMAEIDCLNFDGVDA